MSNVFFQLPAPAANGLGTAVHASTVGAYKTVVVAGSWRLTPNITIEVNLTSDQSGGWAPLETFQGGGMQSFDVACYWMRARVSNFKGGQPPQIWVGGTDDVVDFADLPAPLGNGAAASVDVATFGAFKTVQVAGTYQGSVAIEVSEDGGGNWGQVFSFQSGETGVQSALIVADFMRVKRYGVPTIAPGHPVVTVAATDAFGGRGGAGHSLMALPEKWVVQKIPAGQNNVAMETLVSANFDTLKAIRAGSIVGLSTRLSEAVSAGALVIEVTINGVGTGFLIQHTTGTTGGQATQEAGLSNYAAGDLIGMRYSSTTGFAPLTCDVEAWLEVVETL